jgi:4-amino-4-deoxy-L-arabinose transferase-like glycosyltransferase
VIAALDVLFLSTVFRIVTAGQAGFPLGMYDEKMYLQYANTLHRGGFVAYRDMIARFPADGVLRNAPPILRVLSAVVSWASCKAFQGFTIEHIAYASMIEGVLTVVLASMLFRRWLKPRTALVATLLLLASPLANAMARRALQESLIGLTFVAAVWLQDRAGRSGRRRDAAAFCVALTLALLSKESALFLAPTLLLAAIAARHAKVWRASWVRLVAPLPLAAILYVAVSSLVAGGLHRYVKYYVDYKSVVATMKYADLALRGPWYTYLVGLLLLYPLTTLLAAAGIARTPGTRETLPGRQLAAIYLVGGLAAMSLLSVKHERYLIPLEPFLCALAALGAESIAELVKGRRQAALIFVSVAGLAVFTEVTQFRDLFVTKLLPDPVTLPLFHDDGFSPVCSPAAGRVSICP